MPTEPSTQLITAKQLSHLLRGGRKRSSLTQAELAGRLGLSQGRVSHLEQFPQALSFAQLLAWCAALELELSINERNSTATAGAAAQEW